MKNYVSPVIFDNEELAEGVYATGSGADCYTVDTEWTQRPEGDRKYFVLKVTCNHNAVDGHHSTNHTLKLSFNRAVNCSYAHDSSGIRNYGMSIEIDYFDDTRWHNNAKESIGLADIHIDGIEGDAEPQIISKEFTCDHYCSQGHTW